MDCGETTRKVSTTWPPGLRGGAPRGWMYVCTGIEAIQPKAHAAPYAEKRTSTASTLHLRSSHSRLRRGSTCVSVLTSRECLQNCIVGVCMLSGLRGSYGHVGRKRCHAACTSRFPTETNVYHQYGRRSPEGPCQACARTYSAWIVLDAIVRPGRDTNHE